MGKIFSRSDSSSTKGNRGTRFNHAVQRQVELNRQFDVFASSERFSNKPPATTAFHRSNRSSIAAKTPNTSYTQPDINLERANSCKGFALPLSGNPVHSAEHVKRTNAVKNVSQLPRSTESHKVRVKDASKIDTENDYGQNYQSAYRNTSVSKNNDASYLNVFQSTTKPEYTKQTTNQTTLMSSVKNVDNVNPSELGQTIKRKMPSTSISTTRTGNREYRSIVEVERGSTYNMPAISQQGKTFNKNNTTQTSSNIKTSVFVFDKQPADQNKEIGGLGKTHQSTFLSKTGASSITNTSASISSLKVVSPKLSDQSRGFGEVLGNSQQLYKKVNTVQTSDISSAHVSVPLVTSYKHGGTAISGHISAPPIDDEASPIRTNCRSSIPQRTRTCIDANKFVEKPGARFPDPPWASISTFPNADLYQVKDSSTESNFKRLNPSGKISKPFPARVTPIPAKKSEDLKPQYSLKNFTYKLQTPPKDHNFKLENGSIYHNQWTECSAQIFNNPGHSAKTVNVTSNSPYVNFRDINVKKSRLHFRMKCCQTGNISILIKIDNFTLSKDLYVTFNPCSSFLSNMTFEKMKPTVNEFVFRVFIFDVFGEPVPSNSTSQCQVEASFQSTSNKVVLEQERIEQGQICYNITVTGERPWSRDLVVLLNGEQVSHVREFEFTDEECGAIDDLEDEDYEWIQQFFGTGDCGLFIPLTTGEDDGKFVAYDENDCELQNKNHKLVCKNVRKYDILGADFAHVDNMKRVLELKDRIEVEEINGRCIIDLRNIKSHLYSICKELVQHLLRGLYYRKKASEAARVRMKWKNRLINIDEVLWLDKETPSFVFCKYFKEFFGDLLNKYNREACDELFKFFNFSRDESEIDLHGLLVANEKKLQLLRLNLLIGFLDKDQIMEILKIHKIKSKQGREIQTLKRKFRSGEVRENVVKRFIRGDRENVMDELEHECSDEDCNLCFQNDSDNYGSEYDEEYDDYSECYDDNGGDYYDSDSMSVEYYDDDSEFCDDEGSEYDDDDGRGYRDLESSRNSGRSECFQNESSRHDDRVKKVDAIIAKCRLESDEAIRKLKEKLDKFNLQDAIKNNTPWLEIIVGAGRHSKNNEQNIRPKVEKFLKKRKLRFTPVNKGSLVVTFQAYSGPEPCFGEYYCEKCDRSWKSSKSYVGKYQKCARCKDNHKCWPVKQREKEKVVNYHRDGPERVVRQSKPHQSSLCQKCQELKRPCNESY